MRHIAHNIRRMARASASLGRMIVSAGFVAALTMSTPSAAAVVDLADVTPAMLSGKTFYTKARIAGRSTPVDVYLAISGSSTATTIAAGSSRETHRGNLNSRRLSYYGTVEQDYPGEVGFGANPPLYTLDIDLKYMTVKTSAGLFYLVDTEFLCAGRAVNSPHTQYSICEKTIAYLESDFNVGRPVAASIFDAPIMTGVVTSGEPAPRRIRENSAGGRKPATAGVVEEDGRIRTGEGSGFALSANGDIVTNNHVIEGCSRIEVLHGGKTHQASLVATDTDNDLALLRAPIKPAQTFAISARDAGLLEEIFVSGYPFGDTFSQTVKVTKGIVSALSGIGDNAAVIQIDAAVQQGSSGGPIIDGNGEVVGVTVAKLNALIILLNSGTLPENSNFGIKSSILVKLLTANKVNYRVGPGKPMARRNLGALISDATIYVSCWMTKAEIRAAARDARNVRTQRRKP